MDQDLKQQVNDLERKLNNFIDQYERNSGPSSQIFTKKVTIAGGLSLNGSSLGSTGDLMSVYGETPVAQAAAISAPTAPSATYVQAEHTANALILNNIRIAIANFGISA